MARHPTVSKFNPPALTWRRPNAVAVPVEPGDMPLTDDGRYAQGFRAYFLCERCNTLRPSTLGSGSGGTGYGYDSETGAVRCYQCCAEVQRETMRATGATVLYLTRKPDAPAPSPVPHDRRYPAMRPSLRSQDWRVSDWGGALDLPVYAIKRSAHNWSNVDRVDVWFIFDGYVWHGVNLGDNQILRAKRTRVEWREKSPGHWGEFKPRKARAIKAQ